MRTILPMRTTSLLVLVRILAIAIIVGLAGIDWTRLAISAQAQDQQKKEALEAESRSPVHECFCITITS